MDKLLKILTSSISRVVFDKPQEEFGALSIEQAKALFACAKGHDLAHILGYDLKDSSVIPEEVKKYYVQAFMTAVSRHEMISHQLTRVKERFNQNKLYYIPLKGAVIKNLYPQPWMRTSTDIDILIKREDLEIATKLLIELGFEKGDTLVYDIAFTIDNSVTVELHFGFYNEKNQKEYTRLLEEIWQTATVIDGSFEMQMTDKYLYYYHLEHMAKHVKHGGCGMRSFVDLVLLNQMQGVDADGREEIIKKANLEKFNNACVKLANVWFNGESHQELTKCLEEYILNGGTFGTFQTQANAQVVRRGSKTKFIFSRIFLPYSDLTERYPKLKKHKCLLPYYQVHRWVAGIFKGKGKDAKKQVKASLKVSKKTQKQLKQMFNNLDI